ncbi:hypothetical protein M1146_07785, partial [Patescibacteria group bacterium]|nr:hypothetical protein [Patescibacteria group bacterium]
FDSMDRAILLFDTSSLPDDASISAATLSLYVADKNDDYAQDVGITSSNPASNTAIVTSDTRYIFP